MKSALTDLNTLLFLTTFFSCFNMRGLPKSPTLTCGIMINHGLGYQNKPATGVFCCLL